MLQNAKAAQAAQGMLEISWVHPNDGLVLLDERIKGNDLICSTLSESRASLSWELLVLFEHVKGNDLICLRLSELRASLSCKAMQVYRTATFQLAHPQGRENVKIVRF